MENVEEVEYPFEETIGGTGDENRIRGNWSSKLDYYLSVFGFTFALGNLWRFPCQCSINGGVAYLIPYVILLFLTALPIMFIELALGQFVSLGPISVWKLCPLFKGIGVSMFFISCVIAIYYNMVTAWAFHYIINSVKFSLPWASCGNEWNTENCSIWNRAAVETCRLLNGVVLANGSCISYGDGPETLNASAATALSATIPPNRVMPSIEYFHNQVLMISSGLLDFQTINWQLAICLLMAWMLIFLCSFKGVKTSGKVVYLTAVLPYLILFALFVRFLTLPGSLNGLQFFFKPRWEVLYDLKVWGEAAVQVFYSLSSCTGGIIVLSSYNRFHNNLFRDIWIISLVDLLTSVFVASLVFSAIGFVCYEMDISLGQFHLQEGLQVIFVFFAEALSKLPVAQLYALLFFGMVGMVIFNTELFIIETIVSTICDEFPEKLRRNHRHVLTFVLIAFYFLGLPLCSSAGIYWVVLLEHFSATWPLLIIAFFEVMVICWIYGVDNFLDNVKWMVGFYPPVYLFWKMLWKFVCPLLFMVILSFVWLEYRPLSYDLSHFPHWAMIFGWIISLSPIAIIFGTAVYKFLRTRGTFAKRWRDLLCPEDDWGPALAVHRAELYPLQIPEARKLIPYSNYYQKKNGLDNAAASVGVEQFIDRYSRAVARPGAYPQQSYDKIIARKERETII